MCSVQLYGTVLATVHTQGASCSHIETERLATEILYSREMSSNTLPVYVSIRNSPFPPVYVSIRNSPFAYIYKSLSCISFFTCSRKIFKSGMSSLAAAWMDELSYSDLASPFPASGHDLKVVFKP
ncbi:hypothetical protein J6590_034457 [Homalodisca vitripennis]|nr:hypothetical protein J6590_034457 [Homalodisca vitripennis]